MGRNSYYYYIVEGENEKKLIETLKINSYILAGKIKILNVVQNLLTNIFLRTLEPRTTVILVFDTDIQNKVILEKNIEILKTSKNVINIIYIPQIKKFEDELIYSTNIKKIENLLNSSSRTEFKKDFNNCNNILQKLNEQNFNIAKIWTRNDNQIFKSYENGAYKIKIR